MRHLRTICAWVLLLALTWPVQTARADQTSPELDPLFNALLTASDPQEAVEIEEEIWRIWLQHEDAEVLQRMSSGLLLMNSGHLRDALAVYTRLVKRAPQFAEAWNKRATVTYHLGQYTASMEDIRRTLALEPRHFGALSGMSLIFEQLGRYQQAIDALEAALEIHPHLLGGAERLAHLKQMNERDGI